MYVPLAVAAGCVWAGADVELEVWLDDGVCVWACRVAAKTAAVAATIRVRLA